MDGVGNHNQSYFSKNLHLVSWYHLVISQDRDELMYFKGELPFLVGPNFGDRTNSTEKTIDENVST